MNIDFFSPSNIFADDVGTTEFRSIDMRISDQPERFARLIRSEDSFIPSSPEGGIGPANPNLNLNQVKNSNNEIQILGDKLFNNNNTIAPTVLLTDTSLSNLKGYQLSNAMINLGANKLDRDAWGSMFDQGFFSIKDGVITAGPALENIQPQNSESSDNNSNHSSETQSNNQETDIWEVLPLHPESEDIIDTDNTETQTPATPPSVTPPPATQTNQVPATSAQIQDQTIFDDGIFKLSVENGQAVLSVGNMTQAFSLEDVPNLVEDYANRTVSEGSATIMVQDKNGNQVEIDLTDKAQVQAARTPDETGFVLLPYEFT